MDDIRNHDPSPTAEERSWMEIDLVFVLGQFFTLFAIAVSIGVAGSNFAERPIRDDVKVAAHRAG
jgi:hypothetical protein